MKKIFTLALTGMLFTVILASCGTKKKGSCDAYGSVDKIENSDLANK